MKKRHCLFLAVLTATILTACVPALAEPSTGSATSVILLVGDGMGPSVIGLAKDYARVVEDRRLWMEKAISDGGLALVQAPALGTLVTDSAAAATAMATGQRTVNGTISLGPDREPLTTILELARKDSRATGLVTTTRLTHATPAAFAAHVAHRDSENEIAEHMLASGADVMLGGGLRHWIPAQAAASDFAAYNGKSKREDEANLVDKARDAGYTFVTDKEELAAANGAGKLLGLFSNSHMPYVLDRQPDDAANEPSLVEMTNAALDILSKNDNGFFLLVEGGRIDHAAHANDAASMIADMLEFDKAVGAAMKFARKNGETTVYITADHVTAGPCLAARYSDDAGDTAYPKDSHLKIIARQDASFENILTALSKDPTPARLKRLVLKHTGIELEDADVAFVLKGEPLSPYHVIKPRYRRFGYPALALGRILGLAHGITFATGEHVGEPVLLIGYGPNANLAHGYIENKEIFNIMKAASGL